MVPDPAQHFGGPLYAAEGVWDDGAVGGEEGGGFGGEGGVEAAPDEEDVAEAGDGALGGETGLEVGEGDRGCGEGVIRRAS